MSEIKQVKTEKVMTPSEEIINKNNQVFDVIDELGRTIIIKYPKLVDQYKLVLALGSSSDNPRFCEMIAPLLWVKSIDGVPLNIPTNINEVFAAVSRIDTEGMIAVNLKIAEIIENQGDKQDEVEAKEKLKK